MLYLGAIAERLGERLRELGRERWAAEDCAALEDPRHYEPDPAQAWERLRGVSQLDPLPRARAKSLAVWREKLAREHDLPRAWIIPDAAIFAVAQANPHLPRSAQRLVPPCPPTSTRASPPIC